MFRNFLIKFFPMPEFLSAPSFGLNISDQSLRFVKIGITHNGMKLSKYGERDMPVGVIESGKIKNIKKMEEILTALKKDENLKSARVSLPEELIYIYNLKLEKKDVEDIRESIELSLEEHVPLQTENAIFDYEVLKEEPESIDVQVAVIQKDIIRDFISVFSRAGISVSAFELEAQAIARVVIKKNDPGTYMIVDFGERKSGISIVSDGVVEFTSTVDIGGTIFSKMIQKSLKVTFEEAEKIKMKYGLQRNAENKEIFPTLLNNISILCDEIKKHFLYWHTHKSEDGKEHSAIKKIIFCGGSSNLTGLTEYFSASMKSPVEIADVWVNFTSSEKKVQELTFKQSLSYATALGLAYGDINND